MTTRPRRVWAEVTGGDPLGRGQQPALCWWLPEDSSVQHAYRLRTDDGYDTGRVEGAIQSFVRLPAFDRSRRSALAQVKVWTDLGESAWSDPPGTTATVTLPGAAPQPVPPAATTLPQAPAGRFHDRGQFRANSTGNCPRS